MLRGLLSLLWLARKLVVLRLDVIIVSVLRLSPGLAAGARAGLYCCPACSSKQVRKGRGKFEEHWCTFKLPAFLKEQLCQLQAALASDVWTPDRQYFAWSTYVMTTAVASVHSRNC